MTAASLSPSAYADTFARDHLPPADQWPTLEFTTEWLQYPERLNAGTELIDGPSPSTGPTGRPCARLTARCGPTASCRRRANQVAHVLVDDLGLVTGNRVLLRSPNNPWTVAAWLGVLKAGGIVVTTMAGAARDRADPDRRRRRDPRSPWSTTASSRTCRRCATASRRTWSSSPTAATPRTTSTRRVEGQAGEFTAADTAADDVALFGPTSGTTGVPKITTHFHRDVLAIDNTFGRALLELTPDDVVACTAPLAFTFGLGMLVVFPLRAGACALLTESATPAQLADLVAEHGVTVLATAPTAYKQILQSGHVQQLSEPPGRGVGRRAHGAGDVGADRGASSG